MAERQFSDEEVAAIFEKASEAESLAPLSAGKGMTLAALQEIGRKAKMSPEKIVARASLAPPVSPRQIPDDLGPDSLR